MKRFAFSTPQSLCDRGCDIHSLALHFRCCEYDAKRNIGTSDVINDFLNLYYTTYLKHLLFIIGLEDENLPQFNIFIHLGKIMREFENLRKKQMTTSKSVSFDLNEQDNFRQQERQQQQQQSLSTTKTDIVLPNKTKHSISTSDDKVSTSTTTTNTATLLSNNNKNTSNVKTAVIIPSSTLSVSSNSTTGITSTTTNSIKVPLKSNLKKPSIIQKTLAKTSTTTSKTLKN